jgi:hypothetical protein
MSVRDLATDVVNPADTVDGILGRVQDGRDHRLDWTDLMSAALEGYGLHTQPVAQEFHDAVLFAVGSPAPLGGDTKTFTFIFRMFAVDGEGNIEGIMKLARAGDSDLRLTFPSDRGATE